MLFMLLKQSQADIFPLPRFLHTQGDGTTTASSTPVAVSGGMQFSSISATAYHTCALVASTGAAMCWGYNGYGRLVECVGVEEGVPACHLCHSYNPKLTCSPFPVSSTRRAMAPPQPAPLPWPCLEACSSPASVPVMITRVPGWHPQEPPCAGVTMAMAK